jgi:outer membrane lipoprotein-sorting protein
MKFMATLLWGLLAAALVRGAQAQDDEAEKLFRAMEKKIAQAKAFRVSFTIETKGDTKERLGRFKGSLLLTNDNKGRMKISGIDRGQARNWDMVSDGKQVKLEGRTLATPKKFHSFASTFVTRLGVFPGFPGIPFVIAEADRLDKVEGSKLDAWNFKAGTAEKVDGRDAKVVSFKVGEKGDRDAAAVTVWIDRRTLLPLKRVVVVWPRSAAMVTETYNQFTLDPKLDAGTFELPK